MDCRLAAGGCRMQPGLTVETLTELAQRMTLKQRVLGLNVDGAKCGIDGDPRAPGSQQVLLRFLGFLRDELQTRFSMGCDMGTRFDELERLARSIRVGSIKGAVRSAQELTAEEFQQRMSVLDAQVGGYTVSQRRAGHALANVALTAARHTGHRATGLQIGLQGFGNLGRAAAESLVEAGAYVTAVGDVHGCAVDPHGLEVDRMLRADRSYPVMDMLGQPLWRLSPGALFQLPLDVLVLAAAEDAMTPEQARELPVPVVVVGANCGLRPDVERILTDRGVVVMPDFIGGCGGSASMEVLFGPADTPSPEGVLDGVARLVTELVTDVLDAARERRLPAGRVAQDMAASAAVFPDRRPYGASPYLSPGPRPSGNRVATGSQYVPTS